MEGESSSLFRVSSQATEAVLQTLTARGWCLGDTDQLRALIIIQTALSDDTDAQSLADSVQSELLNTDLRTIGSKCLPDPTTLRKISYLQGPKVLQISAVRDISVSGEEGFVGSGKRRLLRFVLTDGKSEITAVEFSPIPSIPSDIVPGTKVRLENKVPIRSGIVCLNTKVITVQGGVVQSLYDEWQMNQKYSGFSRSSLRLSQQTERSGPPKFEKLQIGSSSRQSSQGSRLPDYPGSTSKSSVVTSVCTAGNAEYRQINAQSRSHKTGDKGQVVTIGDKGKAVSAGDEWRAAPIEDKGQAASVEESVDKKPTNSETRPKEVSEAVPVQNQEAAQKLLQKMSHGNHSAQRSRGRRNRGKGKGKEEQEVFTLHEWEKRNRGKGNEEQEVFTLDEWEKRNNEGKPSIVKEHLDTSQDEYLALQLQNQLDMEDSLVQSRLPNTAADDIRLRMFNYGRDSDKVQGMEHGERGGRIRRGKGKGKGRGRWKGGRF